MPTPIENEMLTALAFYANKANYRSPSTGFALQHDPMKSPIDLDNEGDAARRALQVFYGNLPPSVQAPVAPAPEPPPPEYAKEVTIELSFSRTAPGLLVPLKACPKYKTGAYYVGRLQILGTWFKAKAVCVCSTAGGRAWMAWDERLEETLDLLQLKDFRQPTRIDLTLPGGPPRFGEFIVVIHPLSESEDEDDE